MRTLTDALVAAFAYREAIHTTHFAADEVVARELAKVRRAGGLGALVLQEDLAPLQIDADVEFFEHIPQSAGQRGEVFLRVGAPAVSVTLRRLAERARSRP